ncbi:hypothetical protein FEDK69T_31530 [Flavobacterium enshiense DK69]|uniref:Uncharacterized protein n=1 Tax=Flavobacterium enshiense DK69 TaxID=1107311 RepID=V6RYB8_9FLAO|nr:hypothetical protein [Flavobacterium enshiense]ESU19481.1 hypothetical protein FEDK69T_31530 [Flavobacterium enshiense DK69]KGO92814.1 hypothetical protein Q767_15335 [Flavobacterium enshiense DK69]
MLTYNELIELRDKLANGEISLELAKAEFWNDFKEGQRSWHTKDWKERRSKFIKDKCQICSSKEILTIQHLSHPRKHTEYIREITRGYAKEYMNSNPEIDKSEFSNYVLKNYDYVPVPLCPNCKGKNPSERVRKTPKYRCADCKHEFDEAVYKSVNELISIFYENEEAYEVRDKCFVSKDKWRNKNNLSNVRYWLQRDSAKNKDAETIEKEAFLQYLNDNIKYLSFEDTITACRKCASSYDLHKMELCPKCNTHYKGIQYPTCIECLPEDKRKAALEIIEFGKEWREMHKKLGID